LILVSDIHGDHFNLETLTGLTGSSTIIVAPQVVLDKLSPNLLEKAVLMNNGDSYDLVGLKIEAVPMYNLPESEEAFHAKGRGNGYIVSGADQRIYIAGDTSDIPEMRELKDIDIAFIPMNLPYTMTVEAAADAVLAFAPKNVYPYHFRGTEGLSDVAKFSSLVNETNSSINVTILDWYPEVE
jgi:L-ascorbate metabolism protein UlaG (beta-lactamase superfamily)